MTIRRAALDKNESKAGRDAAVCLRRRVVILPASVLIMKEAQMLHELCYFCSVVIECKFETLIMSWL